MAGIAGRMDPGGAVITSSFEADRANFRQTRLMEDRDDHLWRIDP